MDNTPTIQSSSASSDQDSDVSVVLVCWNNKDYLEPCLISLYENELSFSFDVVVVDNGSTDGSQEMLSEKFPQALLIQNDRNVGLSTASNQGIEATTGRYILLLNNDTLVNQDSLETLAAFMDDHPGAGASGGKLLNPDGTFQAGYGIFPNLTQEFLIATGLGRNLWENYPLQNISTEITSVDWIQSAFLFLRRNALDQVGLFDENFFIYGDEVDLQYRLKLSGWQVYYLPQASTIHYGGRSMNRWSRRKMVYRGKLLFFQNNYSRFSTFSLKLMLVVLSFFKLIVWGILWLIPNYRQKSYKELRSNMEVIQLCFSN